MSRLISLWSKAGVPLVVASAVSVGLLFATIVAHREWDYSWMVWNLFLAWIPLLFVLWLLRLLRRWSWLNWRALAVTLGWLLFLPNSFYIVTDLIHLAPDERAVFMLDVLMFTSFAVNGLLLGFISLYLVHMELRKRAGPWFCSTAVAVILLVSSYAIYVGRFLRWNSWDVVVNAPSLLFEVTDSILRVRAYDQLIPTTLGFFVLLASMYAAFWHLARQARTSQSYTHRSR